MGLLLKACKHLISQDSVDKRLGFNPYKKKNFLEEEDALPSTLDFKCRTLKIKFHSKFCYFLLLLTIELNVLFITVLSLLVIVFVGMEAALSKVMIVEDTDLKEVSFCKVA